MRDAVGVDRIMWGSDFPHREGCWPYSHEHLRLVVRRRSGGRGAAMVGGNAAELYGFDLDALAPVAAQVGPPSTRWLARSMSRPSSRTTRCAVRSFAAAARAPRAREGTHHHERGARHEHSLRGPVRRSRSRTRR